MPTCVLGKFFWKLSGRCIREGGGPGERRRLTSYEVQDWRVLRIG